MQPEGPEGVTGPRRDSDKNPLFSIHVSPSIGLAAMRGCRLETTNRRSNSSLERAAILCIIEEEMPAIDFLSVDCKMDGKLEILV